jgi:4-amino-4-deoxy-L-arabinose transferase-like glycosyltransferase
MSLWDRDEACNAQCAREMLERKDPIVPTFNFRLRTDKPPLEYWAMMASYRVFGVNEFAARLPSVLFSAGTVLLIFFFGSRMWGGEVGFLASLIMLTSVHFPIVARAATPDPAFLFFLTLSLFLFLRGHITWGYIASGFAVLTKGPLGIIIPLGTEVLYLLFSEGKRGIRKVFPLMGPILFLVVTLPWYIMVDIKTHHQFYKGFILYHNITRFVKPIGGHKGPVFYYVAVLILAFVPWSPLLLQTGYRLFRRVGEDKKHFLFLYTWILFPFLIFSLARTKLPNYILPVYPALVLSTAYGLKGFTEDGWSKALRVTVTGILVLITALAFLLGWMWHKGGFVPFGLFLMAVGLLLLTAWGFYRAKENPIRGFYIMAVFMAAFLTATPYFLVPCLEQKKPSPIFAQEIKANMKGDDLIVTHPFSVPSLVFYTNHRVIREKKTQSLEAFFRSSQHHRIFLLTKEKRLELIKQIWKGQVGILENGESIYPKGRLVLLLLKPTTAIPRASSGGSVGLVSFKRGFKEYQR